MKDQFPGIADYGTGIRVTFRVITKGLLPDSGPIRDSHLSIRHNFELLRMPGIRATHSLPR